MDGDRRPRLLLGEHGRVQHLLLGIRDRQGEPDLADDACTNSRAIDPLLEIADILAGDVLDAPFSEPGRMTALDIVARGGDDVDARSLREPAHARDISTHALARDVDDGAPTHAGEAGELGGEHFFVVEDEVVA
jgi:hypothetical protein